MRTLLICHHDDRLDREGLARWLASFSELAGVLVIHEEPRRALRRIRRELDRTGLWRFLDVLAFRVFYRLRLAGTESRWMDGALEDLRRRYPPVPPDVKTLTVRSPNSDAAERFLRAASPDVVIARCKFILKESVFSVARSGTFVLHPGICPEYRNAHGCFWALANDDLEQVGVTLLRVDAGVDTGPILGYYRYPYDERAESHVRIQYRSLLENLDAVRDRLLDAHQGRAAPIDTRGRHSAMWGQPWLSRHLRWKARARARSRA